MWLTLMAHCEFEFVWLFRVMTGSELEDVGEPVPCFLEPRQTQNCHGDTAQAINCEAEPIGRPSPDKDCSRLPRCASTLEASTARAIP